MLLIIQRKDIFFLNLPVHQLNGVNLELICIHLSKLLQCKSPAVQTRAKTNATLAWVNANLTHGSFIISISSNNDVDVFDNTLESLVESFLVKLELKERTVHFIHEKDRLDTFTNSLTQYSFGLHTDARNAIYDDQGSVSYTKSSCYLR